MIHGVGDAGRRKRPRRDRAAARGDRGALSGDLRTQYAVRLCLQIIGEAVRRLSDDVRARAPAVPWRQIGGLRHRLVHAYHDVDPDLVYVVIVRDLTLLDEAVGRLMQEWDDGEPA